jgi:hypothetical protein
MLLFSRKWGAEMVRRIEIEIPVELADAFLKVMDSGCWLAYESANLISLRLAFLPESQHALRFITNAMRQELEANL